MDTPDTLTKVALELSRSLLPLSEAVSDFEHFENLVAGFGWDLSGLTQIPGTFSNLRTLIDALGLELADISKAEDISPEKLDRLLRSLSACFGAINNIKQGSGLPARLIQAGFPTIFPRQLVDFLLIDFLSLNFPVLAYSLAVLGLIRIRYQKASGIRTDFMSYVFSFEDLPSLVEDPRIPFRNAYGWGSDNFDAGALIENLDNLLAYLGANVFIEYTSTEVINAIDTQPSQEVLIPRTLKAFFFDQMSGDIRFAAGLGLFALQKLESLKPGLALLPFVSGSFGEPYVINEELSFTVDGDLDAQGGIGIALRPETGLILVTGLNDPASAAKASGRLLLKLTQEKRSGDPIQLLGTIEGSRLEYNRLSMAGGIEADGADHSELFLEIELFEGNVVIKPTNPDSFLQSVLPSEGITASINLAVGISKNRGFYFRGSSALESRFPVSAEIGTIEVQAIRIAVRPRDEKLPIELSGDVRSQLGPLNVVIERIGLNTIFSFSNNFSGNLGPLQLDFGFAPPTGLGLTIDGGGFTGGGFLRYIESDQRYEGALELEYQDKITLKAIGLLTTRLPGDQLGYSLLIIITTEFTPLQLGLGFTLNGVGGLLGLNRTANAERLRTGLRENTLNNVLFPQNVVENASRILSELDLLFPAQEGRFIFGPMARIGWGTPTLITIDMGLLIEIPDPVRVLILGVIRALLPDDKAKLLQLQVNFLGEIDFESQRFFLDASLYNSKLLSYTLSGDMAVRLIWGNESNFLITAGGFHPAYQPPPLKLPPVRRLSLQLVAGDNPRLTLETYFAISSNTVQFGAKVELLAKAGKFNIYGFLSFDVLFQFNPFYFIAEISAKLALRVGSSEIASISLDFTLEGPTPWHAKGTAKLKICWFLTVKVRFDKTFGEERNTRLDDIRVLPLLQAALSDPGNWEAQTPGSHRLLVSLKSVQANSQVLVYPFGVLTIQQRVVPLKIKIQRFGSQRSADGDFFAIESVRAGQGNTAEDLDAAPVQEQFAPAQFFDLSDSQKLSSKSFERYTSGVKLIDSEKLAADHAVRRVVEYDLHIIDAQREQTPRRKVILPELMSFEQWAVGGAIATSPLSHARNRQSALAPGAVQVEQEKYAVVNASDLRPVEEGSLAASEADARNLLAGFLRVNPALEGEILVVPAFEVNRS